MSKLIWFWRWEHRTIRAALTIALQKETSLVSLREAAQLAPCAKRESNKLQKLGRKMEAMGFGSLSALEDDPTSSTIPFQLKDGWRSEIPRVFTKNLSPDS